MTVADEVADYLTGLGLVPTFSGILPDSPTPAIAVIETNGMPGVYTHNQRRVSIERPRFQITVRAATYVASETLAQAVYQAVDDIENQALNGVQYLAVKPVQRPFLLRRDQNEAVVFAFNADAWRAA